MPNNADIIHYKNDTNLNEAFLNKNDNMLNEFLDILTWLPVSSLNLFRPVANFINIL